MIAARGALLLALAAGVLAPGVAHGQTSTAAATSTPAASSTATTGAAAPGSTPVAAPLDTAGQTPTMLVVDTSGSMDEDDGNGTTKIDGAKSALLDFVGGIERGSRVGLRTYPDPASSESCGSGRLAIDIGPVDPDQMSASIRGLEPDGDTPTAEALRSAVEDIQATGAKTGKLVLVSDGHATCEDPCDEAKKIRDEGFRIDAAVVGFRIDDEGREQLKCIAGALGAPYVDAEEGDDLAKTLDGLTRPDLQVQITGDANRTVIGGGEPFVVEGTVTNDGGAEARDVVVQLGFTLEGGSTLLSGTPGGSGSGAAGGGAPGGGTAGGSGTSGTSGGGTSAGGTADPTNPEDVQPIDVPKPVVRVGNLAPGESRKVTWRVRAAPGLVGSKLGLSIAGRSENSTDTGLVKGQVAVDGVKNVAEAGAVLRGPGTGVALLGDGFASGEGSDDYTPDTDTPRDGCHRSPDALLTQFGGKGVRNLACSGSILAEVVGPRQRAGEDRQPAQTTALADSQKRSGPAQAAVVMAGASDAGMGALLRSCALSRTTCTDSVLLNAPYDPRSALPTKRYVTEHLGADSGLRGRLVGAYRRIDEVLNDGSAVKRRGRAAPILVVGYPVPTPFSARTCRAMGTYTQGGVTSYALTTEEMRLVAETTVRLNGVIEGAVESVRRSDGVPIAYVPAVEMSDQPRNTVCHNGPKGAATQPYVRSVISLTGARINGGALDDLANPAAGPDPGDVLTKLQALDPVARRSTDEIGHPNAAGHDVESLSLLRWSKSPDAQRVVKAAATAGSRGDGQTSWAVGKTRLTGSGTPSVERATTYPLALAGFAPRSRVRVSVADGKRLVADAQADPQGRISATIPVERQVPTGRQTLDVDGVAPDGKERVIEQGIDVQGPFSPPWLLVVLGVSVLAFAIGLLTRRRARRVEARPVEDGEAG
ncbi:VWA domain-containing protein [Patulibacter sp. NPDC049589]|uniref:VWA domain-containing protein n=1 Tax=Patulibacter sp. NPDC049589 TaxID=3154731 RepID=UPI003421113F